MNKFRLYSMIKTYAYINSQDQRKLIHVWRPCHWRHKETQLAACFTCLKKLMENRAFFPSACSDKISCILEIKHPCAGNPCRNGATCVRSGDTYQCHCTSGAYSGKNCGRYIWYVFDRESNLHNGNQNTLNLWP